MNLSSYKVTSLPAEDSIHNSLPNDAISTEPHQIEYCIVSEGTIPLQELAH